MRWSGSSCAPRSSDRLIVAWSERELDVVREYCPQHLDRFEARFRNAREFAVRWRNKCHDGRQARRRTPSPTTSR